MYGLEKKPSGPFEFDLETDLKSDPKKAKELKDKVHQQITELKDLLRKGAETDDFDEYGILLHAYNALDRVLNRMEKK